MTTNTLLWKNIPLTLYSKGLRKGCERIVCVRGELETEQTATYWPQVPLTIAALFSHSAGLLKRGPEGPSPLVGAGSHCPELQLEPNFYWLQLTRTVCGTGLYNCLTYTCFLWASHLHRIQLVHVLRWYLRPLGRRSICYTCTGNYGSNHSSFSFK